MKRKFIILNNGLRDHRGHYFETSISMAEAARRAGWHPVLGAHVDCRIDLFPEWLEVYPVFTTDHWMSRPPAKPADLSGVVADPYRAPCRIEDVADGDVTVRDFVLSRFEPFEHWGDGSEHDPLRAQAISRARNAFEIARWAIRKARWCVGRTMFYFLPPIVHDTQLFLRRSMSMLVPRVLIPGNFAKIKSRVRQILHRAAGLSPRSAPATGGGRPLSSPNRFETSFLNDAYRRLSEANLGYDVDNALVFKRDLERFLALADASADDHVLLGTAHVRELLAAYMYVRKLGEARAPMFHLEFRHPLLSKTHEHEQEMSPAIRHHRLFFSFYKSWGATNRIKFYGDTREIADEYRLISGFDFGVLPIPFRSACIERDETRGDGRLTLAFFGDARDEKGFHWLPDLVDSLMDSHVRTGRIRFLFQASIGDREYSPRSVAALERLQRHSPDYLTLVGVGGALAPEAYFRLVSATDIALFPYERDRYRAASSGTLAEALAAGNPVIVPANSWMSSQVRPGAGETFTDEQSFQAAVRRVIDRYAEYRRVADSHSNSWTQTHSPDALVQAIVGAERAMSENRAA